MNQEFKGSCLCGRVQYIVRGPFDAFHICHCSQCRRSTGSAHASNIFTTRDRLQWVTGEELTKRYDPDEPGVISKSFCTHCGSLVPYISASSGRLIIPAGGLESDPGIRPQDNIYWPDRADWYDAVTQAPRFDSMPDSKS
jgi:hypothetical protein